MHVTVNVYALLLALLVLVPTSSRRGVAALSSSKDEETQAPLPSPPSPLSQAQAPSLSLYSSVGGALLGTLSWIGYGYGEQEVCPFQRDMVAAVSKSLKKHIHGQDEGVGAILNALAAWQFGRLDDFAAGAGTASGGIGSTGGRSMDAVTVGDGSPLVLALTGPTGVGKSETAFRLAEALLAKKKLVRGGGGRRRGRYLPSGLLTLRGEDYAEGDLLQLQGGLRDRVMDHLDLCGGSAVVVLDEVQKLLPGVLEVLMPALDSRGSLRRTHYVPYAYESKAQSASASAAAAALSYAASLASWGWGGSVAPQEGSGRGESGRSGSVNGRSDGNGGSGGGIGASGGSQYEDRRQLKAVTEEHSTENVVFIFVSDIGADRMTKLVLRYGDRALVPQSVLRSEVRAALDAQWARLRFGKVVREVVPYLPLEPRHMRAILRAKLRQLGEDRQFSFWAGLAVDREVVSYLVGRDFISYSVYQSRPSGGGGGGVGKGNSSDHSGAEEDDARRAQTQSVVVEGSGQMEAGGSRADFDRLDGKASTNMGGVFATLGARALENAGPLQDLKAAVNRYAQPWKPDRVLHVGLLTEENRVLRERRWGTGDGTGGGTEDSMGGSRRQVCLVTRYFICILKLLAPLLC
ncbi:hypothetical protein B484DRAFT_442577 [Ochromonadaceae sp. CCMP2298]|nr:hypothetical protein B484DRAFT_442577 [Ochromonadaceae sp. CCMP2298]|mmetsp:Transcript_3776/g.8572  ORF Transcript_3776/g.8572 Transcript_3776/m.8572 type:complete len:633 (+) Transcript_3776:72-1970(+)